MGWEVFGLLGKRKHFCKGRSLHFRKIVAIGLFENENATQFFWRGAFLLGLISEGGRCLLFARRSLHRMETGNTMGNFS